MQPKHICCSHALIIQHDEKQAFHHWQSTMSSGVQAFIQCRMEDAKNYFNAALEIAFLRSGCVSNEFFVVAQLVKPAEFLVEVYLCEENIRGASMVMLAVKEIVESCRLQCTTDEQESIDMLNCKIEDKRAKASPFSGRVIRFPNARQQIH